MTTTRTGSAVAGALGVPSLVRLTGRDARRFCNGMFTNNVRDLPVGGANRHAIVDDRGRIGGFLDLHCEADDTFLAVLEGLDVPAFEQRYAKYIVFDDVELEAIAGHTWWTVQGPHAASALRDAGIEVPEPGRYAEAWGVRAWRRDRSPAGGFDLLATDAAAVEVLAAGRVDAQELEVLRVRAGDPRFPGDTGDKGLPHELNLRGVLLHFEKGCYLGQESINRIDVMGQVKKHLAAIRGAGAPPAEGADVTLDKVVGRLTSPVALPQGGWLGLAVLREPAHTPGTRVTVQADGELREAEVLALPVEG